MMMRVWCENGANWHHMPTQHAAESADRQVRVRQRAQGVSRKTRGVLCRAVLPVARSLCLLCTRRNAAHRDPALTLPLWV